VEACPLSPFLPPPGQHGVAGSPTGLHLAFTGAVTQNLNLWDKQIKMQLFTLLTVFVVVVVVFNGSCFAFCLHNSKLPCWI
jgi:hypothetical protein